MVAFYAVNISVFLVMACSVRAIINPQEMHAIHFQIFCPSGSSEAFFPANHMAAQASNTRDSHLFWTALCGIPAAHGRSHVPY